MQTSLHWAEEYQLQREFLKDKQWLSYQSGNGMLVEVYLKKLADSVGNHG